MDDETKDDGGSVIIVTLQHMKTMTKDGPGRCLNFPTLDGGLTSRTVFIDTM